jgi:hypothetical protein
MTIQFLLQDLPLDRNEVLALMEPSLGGSSKPIKVDLSEFIVGSFTDSQKLFEMAVKNNNKGLVDIAWKIAMNTRKAPTMAAKSPKKITSKVTKNFEKTNDSVKVEDLIEKLNSHQSNWATGAAMLLQATSKGEWKTLKEIACDFVNNHSFNPLSLNYKGFELNRYNGLYEPVELRPSIERKLTFHVSPLYIGLREGLIWCRKHGLVQQKNGISYGSNIATGSSINQMQRVFYKVKATERGEELVKLWADINDYVMNFCMAR